MGQAHFTWMLEKSLWTFNFLANAFVVWRLYSLGLQKTYRCFFAGMALAVIRTAVLPPLGRSVFQQVSGEAVPQGLLILLMICTQQRFAIGAILSVA
jgi:hypothetical protein